MSPSSVPPPAAGCAFVEFRKWAQSERAMEAHNGVTRLPGSEMPLVVKFADAKRPEAQYQGGHMQHGGGRQNWAGMQHGLHPGAFQGLGQVLIRVFYSCMCARVSIPGLYESAGKP